MAKDFNDLKKQIEKLAAKIDNISKFNDNIEQQINTAVITAVTAAMEKLNDAIDARASQQADEKERKRSIVLANLPESEKNTASGRVMDDKQMATRVLDLLGVESPFVMYRMGVRIPARKGSRLCKIVFPSRRFQMQALKEWTKNRDEIRKMVGNPKFSMRWSETQEERRKKMEKWQQGKERNDVELDDDDNGSVNTRRRLRNSNVSTSDAGLFGKTNFN